MKHTALFSLNDTSCADQFAGQLINLGWEIVASAETVGLLETKGIEAQSIADFTGVKEDYGFPPTLHPKVEYALTGSGKPRIDLVYIIPYPLSAGNDIGGRTILALAVKGGRIAVMNIEDMKQVVSEISNGNITEELRLKLANKVCYEIAKHYSSLVTNKEQFDFITGCLSYKLMNGENPYQLSASAFISNIEDDSLALLKFKPVSGEAPCFTNIADADSILTTISLAAEAFKLNINSMPYLCVAAKHGNACGFGVSIVSPAQAIEKALWGNPRSIWGGEVITNFPIDAQLAELLFRSEQREQKLGDKHWMLDLVMSPSFSLEAISILGKRIGRKLFENEALEFPSLKKSGFAYRMVRGGFLRQPPLSYILNLQECKKIGNDLSESEILSLILGWSVAYSSNHGGNEVALAKDGALLSAGGGPSTVEAAKVAVSRAIECGHDTKSATFVADAFFPFTDAPSVLCEAGIKTGCVPSGGKYESVIKDFFHARGLTMAYLPQEFRGFCRH